MRRLTICLAAAAALALPAGATGAIKTYGGKIDKGGKIGIDVTLAGGAPTEVNEMRFKRFPANCSVTGPSLLFATVTFQNLFVVDNKFSIDNTDPDGDHIFFRGRFRNQAKKIVGRIQITFTFSGTDPDPDQTCTTKTRDYSAERGAPAPKARIAKAFRVG